MRRTIWSAVVAAALGLPTVAFAARANGLNVNESSNNTSRLGGFPASRASIGAGQQGSDVIGHVTGPGNAPIDNSVQAPINDVQPGRGTTDTLQNRKPKPVY